MKNQTFGTFDAFIRMENGAIFRLNGTGIEYTQFTDYNDIIVDGGPIKTHVSNQSLEVKLQNCKNLKQILGEPDWLTENRRLEQENRSLAAKIKAAEAICERQKEELNALTEKLNQLRNIIAPEIDTDWYDYE